MKNILSISVLIIGFLYCYSSYEGYYYIINNFISYSSCLPSVTYLFIFYSHPKYSLIKVNHSEFKYITEFFYYLLK